MQGKPNITSLSKVMLICYMSDKPKKESNTEIAWSYKINSYSTHPTSGIYAIGLLEWCPLVQCLPSMEGDIY